MINATELESLTSQNIEKRDVVWTAILSDLVFSQMDSGWIVVITDEDTDAEIKLFQELMEGGFFVSSFKVTNEKNSEDKVEKNAESFNVITVMNEIDSYVVKTSSLHVVINCSWENTKDLLRILGNRSLLCSFHVHWIVFLKSTNLAGTVSSGISRDVNLWLIAPEEGNPQEWNLLMLMYDSTRAHYTPLVTSKWNAVPVETHAIASRLPRNDPFKSLRGKVLRVAIEQHFPFFIPAKGNGTLPKGADIDLLETMRQALNFSYIIKRPPDGKWGALVNGTWDGMIGMVYQQEVDAALGGMTVTASRASAITFSTPYSYDRTTFVARAPSEGTRAWVILRPLQFQVWLAIVSTIVFIAILLGIAERMLYNAKKTAPKIYAPSEKQEKLVTFQDTFLYTYRSFLLQECYNPPDVSTRFVVVSWWIFVVTITTGYNGHLISFMTNPGAEDAMDTIQKLVAAIRQGKFTCGTIRDSSDHNIFKANDSENFATILKSMESDPANFVHHDVQGLARALKMNYVYIAGQLTVDADIKRPELFKFAKDSFQFSGYGIALNKGSWYAETLDVAIHRLREFGLVKKWIDTHIESARNYSDRTDEDEERKLQVADIQGAFFLLCIGFSMSTTVFIIERLIKLCKRKEQRTAKDHGPSQNKHRLFSQKPISDVQSEMCDVHYKNKLILKK